MEEGRWSRQSGSTGGEGSASGLTGECPDRGQGGQPVRSIGWGGGGGGGGA